MAHANVWVASAIWIAACIALAMQADPVWAFIFFLPFSMFPHAVTHTLGFFWKTPRASMLLLIVMVLYAAWFFWVYAEVFYLHPDPQGSIALLFVGVVSTPVMAPAWGLAWWTAHREKSRSPQPAEQHAEPGE